MKTAIYFKRGQVEVVCLLCLGDTRQSCMQKKHDSVESGFHKANENTVISKFGILMTKSSLHK